MGQHSHLDDRLPLAPHLPQSHNTKDVDQAEPPSASHALQEPQTVQEVMDAMMDRIDSILDDLKKLVQQLRNLG